jgi:hypothetical protein
MDKTILEYVINFFSNLFSGFISNSASDLLVGVGIVLLIRLLQSNKQKQEIDKQIRINRERKIFDYLTAIKMEMLDIDDKINVYQKHDALYRYIHLYTSIWETLKSGGELPIIFHPVLLRVLDIYYSKANEINILSEEYIKIRLVGNDLLLKEIEKTYRERIQSLVNVSHDGNGLVFKIVEKFIKESDDYLKPYKATFEREQTPLMKEGAFATYQEQ